MDKRGKIAAFIESLPMETGIGDCQSTLLVTNMDYLGGATVNGGVCINDNEDSCRKSNNSQDCRNYNKKCGEAENHNICLTTDQVLPSTGL